VPLCTPVCAEVFLALPDQQRDAGEAIRPRRDAAVVAAGTAFPM
jgi:hypothetical protein